MPNILRRPMFRLGGQSSDGVGITSGLNRRNYAHGPTTDELMHQMTESFEKSNKALEGYGRPSKGEFALGLSDILRQGGSIYDMMTNAQETVLPMYKDYKTKQAMIEPLKFKNLAAMTGLGIKRDVANKETVQQTLERNAKDADRILGKYQYKEEELKKNPEDYALYKTAKLLSERNPTTRQEAAQTAWGILKSLILAEGEAFDSIRAMEEDEQQAFMESIVTTIMTGSFKDMPGFAGGGRVGLQQSYPGTVEEASMAEQIQTPGGTEDITETEEITETPPPAQDPYVLLRARLPKEISDDVVRLIAYNPEAFKDFAAIENQEDVMAFNQTYGVELVLPAQPA